MAPSLIASYSVDSAGNNTATLTTTAFTPSNGEVIIVKVCSSFTGLTVNTPTGGSQTYTSLGTANFGGFSGYSQIWGATVSGSPGSMSVSVTTANTSFHHMVVERWGSAKLAATPASGSNWYNGATGAPSVNITTAAANSVVTWCSVDEQSLSPAGRAYLLSATEDGIFDGSGGANSVQYFAYASVGAAGTYAMGMSAPTPQRWSLVGVEVQAGSSSFTGTATDAFTTADSVARTVVDPRSVADAFTTADSVARTVINPRATADAFTTADAVARTVVDPRSVADAFTTADTVARTAVNPRGTADAFTTADVATRAAQTLSRPTADAFTTTDAPARTVVDPRGLADAFTTADSVASHATLPRGPTDAFTTADVATRAAQAFTRPATDAFTTADVATATYLPAARDVVFSVWAARTKWQTGPTTAKWRTGPPATKWEVGPLMTATIAAISLEYLRVPVAATANGAPVNPTNDVVQMAFTTVTGTPALADWKTASWDTVAVNGTYYAQCLIGTGGAATLAVGQYQVWIKITDSPEIPARPAGILQIY